MFYPKDNTHIPLIIELKVDFAPEECIKQIKDKKYFNVLGEYSKDVLLVGISYDSKTLKHTSVCEMVRIENK